MKDFHLRDSLLSYDLSKISAKLVISHKHNIIFAKFLEVLLDNNVTFFACTHSLTKQKSFGSNLSLYFPIFYWRHYLTKMFLKTHWKNSTRLGFRWLTKPIETIKFYKKSSCRCCSLCFYISTLIMMLETFHEIFHQKKLSFLNWD